GVRTGRHSLHRPGPLRSGMAPSSAVHPTRPGMWVSASTLRKVRRIVGIVLAVVLIAGVAAAVALGRDSGDSGTAAKTVRGVIGSEKAEFFADPDTVKALAAKGFTVRTETSGSWAMDRLPLKGYDFAFPGSKAPADELRRGAADQG